MGALRKFLIGFFAILLAACGSPSEKRFREEGKRIVQDFTVVLKQVEGREELQSVAAKIKKIFNRLAGLLGEVKRFQKSHPSYVFSKEPLLESEALFQELARLYEIPGCREIIENAGAEALRKLYRSDSPNHENF